VPTVKCLFGWRALTVWLKALGVNELENQLENLWLNTNIIYHFTATAESTIFVIGF
jgi:hypothetical protein